VSERDTAATARITRIEGLSERLFGGTHARLKPRRAGTVKRRRLAVSLPRALIAERQRRLKEWRVEAP
jgi:hypothetical protein